METLEKTSITIDTTINAPIEKVWEIYTSPKHIVHWNNASDDWYTPWSENDLREGGVFRTRMESKDGSTGFDFTGKYIRIEPEKHIEYMIEDGRKVKVDFFTELGKTRVVQNFETENRYSVNQQREGWQSILDNFKKYVEKSDDFEILHFETIINCDVEKVYRTLTEPATFSQWTSVFNESSRFEGSWEKGSTIRFLGTNNSGMTEGMVSVIRENIRDKFISIEHLGIIQNDTEIVRKPEVTGWRNLENYTFVPSGNKTKFIVDVDSDKDFIPYFSDMFPKALEKLKAVCERS
jgi:uncharacterized protein YndB with AHSA1/START domain